MHASIFKSIKDLGAEYVRFAPWYPYPKLAVAELEPPDGNKTSWDFSLIDPIVLDYMEASKGHKSILNFPTIPQWMFITPKRVPYPADPNTVDFSYGGGNLLRDTTLKEVSDYFARIVSWYSKGGFTDEAGKYHKSGHYFKIPYWEVLNEPELEHNLTPEQYTKIYDAVVLAIRKVSPETKFIGMASCVYGDPKFYEYFLNPKNHKPGVPIDMISYHFYAGGNAIQTLTDYQSTYYDKSEHFVTSVKFIENIRKRLNPNVGVATNELGTFLTDEMRTKPIPDHYWNLSSAVFAYLFIQLNKIGIDIINESQLVGYPTQFPDVSMMNWENAKPNARYWTLKLLVDNFGPGDKLVEVNPFIMAETDYAAQGFITPKGKKVLILNKRGKPISVKVPANFKGAAISTVDEASAEGPALTGIVNGDTLEMKANAVSVITIPN
ncbi:glycosyl hydrolase family 39 [Mucilaginibacter hurinus]|uniref:Glycosyl hydrolase family 39 n=2 Tax=Mucilaginibacter hurinus TaxID=2201324 RepID=A0A367GS37_9SPHI|nr:glycosyl hydrolase family 39 [Mucilaginibacter hurinus]